MTTKITTATRLAAEFKGSPRYEAIHAVFQAVDELKEEEPVSKIMTKMNSTMQALNGAERDRMPGLVRQALLERNRSHRF